MTTQTVHPWKDDLLAAYEVRKSYAQKTAFIEHLTEIYGERLHVEESGKLIKSRNIVLGNPDTAAVIYAGHYDTCAKLPFPNFITPKNLFLFLLYQVAITILLLIPCFGLSILVAWLTRSLLLTELALFAGLGIVLWLMLGGKANPHTANDNTSGVVTVLTLADRLAEREDVCFVLFDNEEIGMFGSMAFAKQHKTVAKQTLLVNFDCVSDGDWLLLVSTKPVRRKVNYDAFCDHVRKVCATTDKLPLLEKSSNTVYPSDQMNFKKSIAVAALKKTRTKLVGYYMDRIHTPKDTVFDDRNIEVLADIFEKIPDFDL